MCTIIERIAITLKEEGKQATDLCEYANISHNTFSNWKRRQTDPNAKYIPKIAEFLGVSEKYLLTGEKDLPHLVDDEAREIAEEIKERPEMMTLFEASRKATKEDIEQIASILERMTI